MGDREFVEWMKAEMLNGAHTADIVIYMAPKKWYRRWVWKIRMFLGKWFKAAKPGPTAVLMNAYPSRVERAPAIPGEVVELSFRCERLEGADGAV